MDYINPFGALPQEPAPESSFLTEMDRGTQRNMAMPFIRMARQQQEMDLAKKQVEHSEFTSPLATQARESGLQKTLTTNQDATRLSPWTTDASIQEAKSKIKLAPYIDDAKIAAAEQEAIKSRGTPAANFYQEVSAINEQVKKLPEAQRPIAAQQFIQQFAARHPGAKIPPMMQKYDPEHWDMASLVALNTAEHQKKMKEQEAKDKEHMARTKAEIAGRERVAEIGAAGRTAVAQLRATADDKPPKTPTEAIHRYTTVINAPDNDPADKIRAGQQLKPFLIKFATDLTNVQGLDVAQKKTNATKILRELENTHIYKPLLEQAGQPFDPEKYEYSLNASGSIDRKPIKPQVIKK